jgi:hypothetical protein
LSYQRQVGKWQRVDADYGGDQRHSVLSAKIQGIDHKRLNPIE